LLSRYTLDGTFLSNISLPTMGSAEGDIIGKELFIDFSSILYPATVFRYNQTHNTLLNEWDVQSPFDYSDYETKQIFYASKDGTKIPMLITHKKNMILDGKNPTLLHGYGGFNVGNESVFDPGVIYWLEQGGVYVSASIRGGSEYGNAWHKAGLREKRQNTFDDFIAAAEWLINNRYTNASKLAINGCSNGGLLVAVCMQQRPDLFGAVISEVPVIDMLRFHLFTCGIEWTSEYGDINNAEEFKALHAYSPLHNVRAGVTYPPLLVTSADNDDRVVSLHAKKWVARLQAVSDGQMPILLRYEADVGHGAGKPLPKKIDALADKYTFLCKALKVEPVSL
jgi:prolyl oligopeptidase